ncbi:MAG TPA: M20/M25/M40 family metallo-hydrolase [Geomonas sp.]
MTTDIQELMAQVDGTRLQHFISALEGARHGQENYDLLEAKGRFIETTLRDCGFRVECQPVHFKTRRYRNIIAILDGADPGLERILLGAHYDSPRYSPGADDNASGTAALLESARILSRQRPKRTIQFVAFTLEEPQTWTHIILRGSKQFVRQAKREGISYAAAIILECVGYTSKLNRSQMLPRMLKNLDLPTGDFLAIIANHRSRGLMQLVHRCAITRVPELKTFPLAVPLGGYLIPQSRFSDQAPFWDSGFPALMLTDTAMFRNPHYHTPDDTGKTLDYQFLAAVTRCAVAAVAELAELQ